MRAARIGAVAIVVILPLLWLGGAFAFLPSDAAIARAFCSRHPGFSIDRVIRGDGDNDQFTFHIQYRTPDSSNVRTAQWLVYTSGVHFGWRLDSEDLDILTHTAATNPK